MCSKEDETISNLLLQCDFTYDIWRFFWKYVGFLGASENLHVIYIFEGGTILWVRVGALEAHSLCYPVVHMELDEC